MTVDVSTGKHIPKNPDRFVFDEEVTPIFDNMAQRSLPLYNHVYDMVGEVCSEIAFRPGDSVWDFGVSTGRGLHAVRNAVREPLVEYHGVDVSQPMLDVTAENCPWVGDLHQIDMETDGLPLDRIENMKVALWCWTLQFMEDFGTRRKLLAQTYDALEPGGILVLAEKWSHTIDVHYSDVATGCTVHDAQNRLYMKFRRDNGYTAREILSKSHALRNSMWPWSRCHAVAALREAGFRHARIVPFYQQFTFGGIIAVK